MTVSLTIDELFTPATQAEWLATLLANAITLQLPVTSWQSGGVARTILTLQSQLQGNGDGITSLLAQAGFLDFCATGSVTYTDASGNEVTVPVTPDPSDQDQNPTGALGWLDVLASSVYNVNRIEATYAPGTMAFANTTASTYGAYDVGTFHVSNPTSGVGYSNVSSLTIAAANLVGGGVTAASNSAPIIVTTSGAHGRSTGDVVYISGVLGNTAANGFWIVTANSATTLILTGSSGNGSYTSGGTVNVCTTATFNADIAGTSGSSSAGTVTELVTTLAGVSCSNPEAFSGSNWETNVALAARCRLKLQSLSLTTPQGGFAYYALAAQELLADEDPPVTLSDPPTKVIVQTDSANGAVIVIVASATGAVSGVANIAVIDATNASPIEIETSGNHGLSTGDFATISGVLGNSNANGTYNITVTGLTTFTLDGTTGNGVYTEGGFVEGGDLGQVDKIIQSVAVGDIGTAETQSATEQTFTILATVEVPTAKVAEYTVNAPLAVDDFFEALDIGGNQGYLRYAEMVGVLYAAGSVNGIASYVSNIPTLTIDGASTDAAFTGPTYVGAVSLTLTVVGV